MKKDNLIVLVSLGYLIHLKGFYIKMTSGLLYQNSYVSKTLNRLLF